jgi:hypothetical protein
VPSSTTSSKGCGWRVVVLAIGGFALAVAVLFSIGAGSSWSQKHTIQSWPIARATVRHCEIAKKTRRSSNLYIYRTQCSAIFMMNGKKVDGGFDSRPAYYEHRQYWWANPGIDELRAWVAQHPDGSEVTVRSDPNWPPTMVLEPVPEIFDYYTTRLQTRIAGIAAVIGIGLVGLALLVAR